MFSVLCARKRRSDPRGTTTTTILTLKGAIAVLATEIAEHEADIAKNNEEMKKLTGIREKENSPLRLRMV